MQLIINCKLSARLHKCSVVRCLFEIMNLEKQVCQWQLAIQLQELGLSKYGNFFWINRNNERQLDWGYNAEIFEDAVHTFTVAELGCMLGLSVDGILPEKYNIETVNNWFKEFTDVFETEADLRAGILIHLIRKGLLSVSTCNERLSVK